MPTTPDTTSDTSADKPTVFTLTYQDQTDDYELIMSGMTFAEARALEKVAGHTFTEIMQKPALRGATAVLQALIWISMKRKIPTLTFSDIDDVAIDAIVWPEDDDSTAGGDQADPDGGEPGPTSAAGAASTDSPVE